MTPAASSDSVAGDAMAASNAATGPGAPAEVRVRRPTTNGQWVQLGVTVVLCAFAAVMIYRLTFAPWPQRVSILLAIIDALKWALILCVGVLGAIAVSPWFSHIYVEAGPAKIDVGSDERPKP